MIDTSRSRLIFESFKKKGVKFVINWSRVYPYLLRGLIIPQPDQVWAADITYIRLHRGWLYLVAIMDWFSRYVLSWETSITMETGFCLAALEKAFVASAPPETLQG